jgi:hypothetical protein
MNYNFQKTHIKVGLWKYFNSYDEKASFIAFGKSWKNSSHGIWNLLMHKTNHGFSKHFQKILLVVYAAVDIHSEQGMWKAHVQSIELQKSLVLESERNNEFLSWMME